MPSGRRIPQALEALAERFYKLLGSHWESAIRRVIRLWKRLQQSGQLTQQSARQTVVNELGDWPIFAAMQFDADLNRIYRAGFLWGISDTGVLAGPDKGDEQVLQWLKTNPNGFIPALRSMTDSAVRGIEGVITDAYRGYDPDTGDRRPFNLTDMVERTLARADVGVNRARLIVRTETAKATAYGRIMAWGDDPDKEWYSYHWIAHHDDRTKDISLKFEADGPYDFAGIKKLWEVDHNTPMWVKNRHTGKMERQTSAYNCRCTPARTPKTARVLYSEGKITYAQMVEEESNFGPQEAWRPAA